MAWYWNEWVYILLWILIGVGILTGAIVVNQTEGFQAQQTDPADLGAFFEPYQVKDVCEIYMYVYPKVVAGELSDGTNQRSEEEARERANTLLKQSIPGTLLNCPISYPTAKSLQDAFEYIQTVPDDFLATVYATLLFCTTRLQQSLLDITKALKKAASSQREGFADVCSKEEAEKKRAEKKQDTCVLPEDIPETEKAQTIVKKLAKLVQIQLTWRSAYLGAIDKSIEDLKKPYAAALLSKQTLDEKLKDKKADAISTEDREKQSEIAETVGIYEAKIIELNYTKYNLNQTIPTLVKACKDLIPKLETLRKNMEAGNYSVPAEGFSDFFQSPLH